MQLPEFSDVSSSGLIFQPRTVLPRSRLIKILKSVFDDGFANVELKKMTFDSSKRLVSFISPASLGSFSWLELT